MFGTSGIRGVYGKDVTESLVLRIANIFADGDVAVGRDTRPSGRPLKAAALAGVAAAGFNAFDLGIVPTPTVALASKKYGRGIMVTASHNPIEHNGIKVLEKGREITAAEGEELIKRYAAGEYKSVGRGRIFRDDAIIDEHAGMILKTVKPERRVTAVVDCNGAAFSITPQVLSDLGCRVISLNASSSEFFRPSEPKKENLASLSATVRATGADIGIAHDADGDRCIILDKTGEQIPMDVQLAMMIESELSSSANKRIAATVEASLLIRETVERLGGKLFITPVGSTHLGLEMEKQDAVFGGEPCGEYIYPDGILVPDGILTAAKFVELASRKDLSELKKKYNSYPIAREKYPVGDRAAAMERIKKALSGKYEFGRMDGLRADEKDGWFLIRPSGTESMIRLTMEYKDGKKLEERKKEIEGIIKKSL